MSRLFLFFTTFCIFISQPARTNAQEKVGENFTKQTVMITVEDTIKLATDLYLPQKNGPFPTILIRSPYNKAGAKGDGERFARAGYAVVIQDTRGKFESGGVFYPFKYERKDGLATVKWIRAQKWSNGKIAGAGGSYVGYTQWAIADQLDAITPILTSANMYDLLYPSGIFSLATAFNWGLVVDSKTVNNIKPEKIAESYSILPLSVADDSTFQQNDFVDDWLAHQYDDAYWGAMNHRSAEICPMYSVAGWYDIFLMAQIRDFIEQGTRRHPDSRLIIGPYAHGKVAVELDFGDKEKLYLNNDVIGYFLTKQLKNNDAVVPESYPQKPFALFIMQRNEWIQCEKWPPEQTESTSFYFASNGAISRRVPINDDAAAYTYDPMNPFMSLGGTFLGVGVGPAFQNLNIDRPDQVVFESDPLQEPLVLVGPIDATLYASTDVPSTDFFVSLQDVRPDGKIINIQEGGKTVFADATTAPRVQKVDMSLWATGYQIDAGHKMRIVVTSSLFPRYNRNLNSGEPIFSAQNPRIAHQKIYFGKTYPSCIRLPLFNLE